MKIVGVQMDISLGEVEENLQRIIEKLHAAAQQQGELVIFPECALTGYCFDSREEAMKYAELENGPAKQQLIAVCQKLKLHCIVGYLEKSGDQFFNAAALLGPDGAVGNYRKVHLPFLGVDRFTDYGDRPFATQQAQGVNIGMNICYDSAFPEASRALALAGADLIALPTNWPPGAECMTPGAICTRAMENKLYYAAINRVGTERGVKFIGRSCICDPNGQVLVSAPADEEVLLITEIDVELARQKRIIRQKDVHEIDRLADRRPQFYTPITEPHSLKTPRQRHTK